MTAEDSDVDDVERNKEIVARIFAVLEGDGSDIDELVDELLPDDYVQHNPLAGEAREGLRKYLPTLLRREATPDAPIEPWLDINGTLDVNWIAEGEFVVRQEIRTHGMLIDIFRVKDGMLREHWDAFRPNPGTERIPGF